MCKNISPLESPYYQHDSVIHMNLSHILYFILKGDLWMTINHAKQNMSPSIQFIETTHQQYNFLVNPAHKTRFPTIHFLKTLRVASSSATSLGFSQWSTYHNWGHLPQLKHLMVTSGGIVEVDAPEEQNTWKTNDIQKWPRRSCEDK